MDVHLRILAEGKPQEEHSCFWMCSERRPGENNSVSKLFVSVSMCLFPNLECRPARRGAHHMTIVS